MEIDETNHRVLVCHADSENSLGVIRSLGQRGIEVVAASHSFFAKGNWSKYTVKRLKEPSSDDPDGYVTWLIDIAKRENIDIFLPTADILVWIASNRRDELSDYIKVPLAPKEVVDIALRKDLTYKACEKYGISYPKTYYPSSYDEVVQLANEIEYPVIIKPRTTAGIEIEGKGFVAKSKEELLNNFRTLEIKSFLKDNDLKYPLIQEFIPSTLEDLFSVNVFFNRESVPIALWSGRRLRQFPAKLGLGTFAESRYDNNAINYAENLMRKIKWQGPAEIEVIKDRRDNVFKIIEINARTHLWVWLVNQSGIDVPYLWYRFAFDDLNNEELKISKGDLAYIYWLKDFFGLPSQLAYAENKKEFIKEYISSIRREKVCAVWNREDPLPFFADLINSLSLIPTYLRGLKQ